MQDWEFRGVWPADVSDYLTVTDASGNTGYDRAEQQMRKQVGLGKFQDDVRTHLNTVLAPDLIASDLPRSLHQPALEEYRRTTGTYSTTDLLLESLGFTGRAGNSFLKVNLHHLATQLEWSGSKITGVVCQDLAGHVGRVSRKVHRPGVRPDRKSGCVCLPTDPNSRMGIGPTDHPAYFYQIYHTIPTTGPLGWIGKPDKHAKIMLRHNSATSAAHAYNIELLINPRYWDPRHADEDLWQRHIAGATESKVEIKFLFDSLLDNNNKIVAKGVGQKPEVYVAANPSAAGYKAEMVTIRNQVPRSAFCRGAGARPGIPRSGVREFMERSIMPGGHCG
jgi:hypothetical protein